MQFGDMTGENYPSYNAVAILRWNSTCPASKILNSFYLWEDA